MHTLSHSTLAAIIQANIDKHLDYKLDLGQLRIGSIKPDFIPRLRSISHYKDVSFTFLKEEIRQLGSSALNAADTRSFSARVGVVLHYLADYFCFAHNNLRLIKNKLEHFCYELEVGQRLSVVRHDFSLNSDCVKNGLVIDPVSFIEEKHEEYLAALRDDPAHDVKFILEACHTAAIALVNKALEQKLSDAA